MVRRVTGPVVAAAVAVTLLAACASQPAPRADISAAGDCPPVRSGAGSAAVDFVDFVRAHGTTYITVPGRTWRGIAHRLGPVQFRVRCSLATLNDLSHKTPPAPRDRDAAFLPAGTSVHAVRGWSPLCRLAARHDGEWHVYLAQRTGSPNRGVRCPPHAATHG